MRVCRTDPESKDDAAAVYRTDEHIADDAGHVFIEPNDDLGGRARLAGFWLS